MSTALAERHITAFMDSPDTPRPDNPIHSTEGGKAYGYKAALVGGVHVYGWTLPAILDVLGQDWLHDGWIHVTFRRPTYPGDRMAARIFPATDAAYSLQMDNQAGAHCIIATLGRGKASWFEALHVPRFQPGEPQPHTLPSLSMDHAPLEQELRPMSVALSVAEAESYAREKVADPNPIYYGTQALIHPGWLAGRPTRLLHHSYTYGPAIHVQSHIQHLAPAYAGQPLVVTGYCQEVYERKDHHYLVNDVAIWSEPGDELVRLRHTTIFQVAKR